MGCGGVDGGRWGWGVAICRPLLEAGCNENIHRAVVQRRSGNCRLHYCEQY